MKPDEIEKNISRIGDNSQITGGTLKANIELVMHSFEQLNKTLDRHAASNDRLSKKVLWLNFIIATSTLVLAVISGLELYYKFFNSNG